MPKSGSLCVGIAVTSIRQRDYACRRKEGLFSANGTIGGNRAAARCCSDDNVLGAASSLQVPYYLLRIAVAVTSNQERMLGTMTSGQSALDLQTNVCGSTVLKANMPK